MSFFFGLSTFDTVYFFDNLPNENGKARAKDFYICSGGPSANAAITYKILGGDCSLITPLGCGPVANRILSEFGQYDLPVVDIASDVGVEPTIASIAVTGDGKNRTIWSFVPNRTLSNLDVSSLYDERPLFVHFDGYFMSESISFAKILKAKGYKIVFDAGSWKDGTESLVELCDVVIASSLFKVPEYINLEAEDSLDWFYKMGVKLAAKTNDEKSIVGYDESGRFEVSPPPIEAVDTLGAGDVFHGAFNFMFFDRNLGFFDALSKASVVASRSCLYVGPREGVLNYKINGF